MHDPYDGPAEGTHASLAILWRLWPWLRPYRGYLILMLVFATAAMVVQSLLPLITAAIVDGPIARHDTSGMLPLIGLALLFGVAEAVLFALRRRAMNVSSLAIETDLRRDFYRHLQRLPVTFHDRWPSGQLLSRVSSDLATLRRFVGFMAVFVIANLTMIVVVLALLIRLQPVLGVAVAIVMLPLAYITRRYEKLYNEQARQAQDLTGDLATEVEESVLGIRVIKSFGRRRSLLAGFSRTAERLRQAELAKNRTLSNLWTVIGTYPQLVLAGVTCCGVIAVAHGTLSRGDLIAFITLQLRLNWPLMAMGWLLAGTEETVAATARLFEVLDARSTILDPARPVSLLSAAQPTAPARLEFDDVSFRFHGAQDYALEHVRLAIEPGETMALVGATGAGKTVLTSLVSRLHDVSAGAVRIDGVPITELALVELRRTVSVAFEEATLFSASVRENLTLGRPEASEQELAEAVEVAQAAFVYDLPHGLDTRVGEQGLSLSGGQRQRLALARAVLGRPRVLVLDDPLSALDVHTEAQVERALRRVLQQTTALVVAHRASTVLLADRVALLSGKHVVAVGTHRQLLASNAEYRNLLSQHAEQATV
ncbi:MAG TPA: ABC transporter ATP-binding protein [Jatrophihabitans sp.]|nr:ABC transporter ATP-binding protein [Jatrophihabitans sp.]